MVSLYGHNFPNGNFTCFFAEIPSNGVYVDSNKITCEAPPNLPGEVVSFYLAWDDDYYIDLAYPFKFFYKGSQKNFLRIF